MGDMITPGKNSKYFRGNREDSGGYLDNSGEFLVRRKRKPGRKRRIIILGVICAAFLLLVPGLLSSYFSLGDAAPKEDVTDLGSEVSETPKETGEINNEAQAQKSDKQDALAAEPSYVGDPYSGYGQLVNRSYPIKNAESYHPDDLQQVSGSSQQMRAAAAEAMNKMIGDFKAENPSLPIYAQSGFRTFERQEYLYNNQINRKGKGLGTIYSAIPGTSEHELGLAMDLSVDGSSLNSGFADTVQGKWFLKHCNEYGYILRYPEDKQEVTGIIYEPWHFRYVGLDIAQDMAPKGKTTLEEYYGLFLKDEDIEPYLEYLK